MAISGVPAYQQHDALRLAPAAPPAAQARPVLPAPAPPRYRVNDAPAPVAKRLDVYDTAAPAGVPATSPSGAAGFGVTLGRYVDTYA